MVDLKGAVKSWGQLTSSQQLTVSKFGLREEYVRIVAEDRNINAFWMGFRWWRKEATFITF